ncbi:MAG TPA: prenyltransferase/squalene oxidase repeat-containing protein [Solirubrobacteraceae bacterium]|nr:prenyltransferase/squalene oxidase repeat-containing protein [Solirubrobacteraceae bacterium]
MSWQLAAFAVLALAIAGGFAWYERARPDARVVALVGTLAAFAALGRIAFAALPNVKPTSDIVLISGYALGGGPGFAIGAIGGLTSNFFFGQGPWTPWQMAAWGVTGMLGAGLALLWRRRTIGRWPLALLCAAAGFAFTAVQDVGDWVTYSDHSAAQLGVYVGQGLGFDAIYAAGCLGFALTFGPALLRSIRRFTRRLEVTWLAPGSSVMPALAVAVAVAAAVGATATHARAAVVTERAASAALRGPVDYLLHAQNGDGGLGAAPGQPSSPLFSGWAALGLESAGVRPQSVERGTTLMTFIERHAGAGDAGSIERNILVARAAGLNPASFGGRDLVAMLRSKLEGNGSIGDQVNLTAFGVLALRAARVPVPRRTLHWLESQANRDGGFAFAGRGGASDVDDTGAALQALRGAHGRAAGVRSRAITYLRRRQDRDGGFPSQPGEGSNAQSTAWAVQGLDAAGIDPASVRRGGRSPLAYLRSLIHASGAIAYARGVTQTPVWVTGEALMALAGKSLPLAPLPAPARRRAHPAHRAPAHPRPRPHHSGQRHAPGATSHQTHTSTTASATTAAATHAPSANKHAPARGGGTSRTTRGRPAGAVAGGSRLLIALGRTGGQTVAALRELM